MQGTLSPQVIYYCLPGEEVNLLSLLLSDNELVQRLWQDAHAKYPGQTPEHQRGDDEADEAMCALSDRFEYLNNSEELSEQLLDCASRWSDAGLAWANEMFIKGLVYGFAYLGGAMHTRNEQIKSG